MFLWLKISSWYWMLMIRFVLSVLNISILSRVFQPLLLIPLLPSFINLSQTATFLWFNFKINVCNPCLTDFWLDPWFHDIPLAKTPTYFNMHDSLDSLSFGNFFRMTTKFFQLLKHLWAQMLLWIGCIRFILTYPQVVIGFGSLNTLMPPWFLLFILFSMIVPLEILLGLVGVKFGNWRFL